MKVIFSREARDDLKDIGRYLLTQSPTRALTYMEELRNACLDLARMPEAFEILEIIGPSRNSPPNIQSLSDILSRQRLGDNDYPRHPRGEGLSANTRSADLKRYYPHTSPPCYTLTKTHAPRGPCALRHSARRVRALWSGRWWTFHHQDQRVL